MDESWVQILSVVAATFVAPVLTELGKRWQWGDKLSSAVNFGVTIALYLGAWAVFDGESANLSAWVLGGAAAAGGTGAGYNVLKQVVKARRQ